jgi:hypothetical protein
MVRQSVRFPTLGVFASSRENGKTRSTKSEQIKNMKYKTTTMFQTGRTEFGVLDLLSLSLLGVSLFRISVLGFWILFSGFVSVRGAVVIAGSGVAGKRSE